MRPRDHVIRAVSTLNFVCFRCRGTYAVYFAKSTINFYLFIFFLLSKLTLNKNIRRKRARVPYLYPIGVRIYIPVDKKVIRTPEVRELLDKVYDVYAVAAGIRLPGSNNASVQRRLCCAVYVCTNTVGFFFFFFSRKYF